MPTQQPKMVGSARRTFTAIQTLGAPARQPSAPSGDLFDITPSDEQKMLTDSVRDFSLAKLRPAARLADATCTTPPELLAAANELGLTTVGIPESLGGAVDVRSAVTSVLMAEALAQGDMGIALACMAPAGVSTALSLWGDAVQQATYLHEFVGERPPVGAIALIEPRALFDPSRLETTAKRSRDGFVVNGVKSMVPRARDGELFVIGADLEDIGPALFLVEAGSGGVTVDAEPGMGIRAAATGTLTLHDVKLPTGALLADGAPNVYRDAVALGRLGWCALAVGTAQAVLDYVRTYVNERVAFGELISHRQAVAFTVANIAIELDGLRLTTYRAAGLVDAGESFEREVALARTLCAKHAMQIGSDGVQLLGGHGYTKEHPVERWYRDLRAAGLMEGALVL